MFSRYQRQVVDHFEPEVDPETQRNLRGHLEKIDYTAYASNKEVIAGVVGPLDVPQLQRLAVAAAQARARWAAAALAAADAGPSAAAAKVDELAQLRAAYEELSAAYDGVRRMVERGYVRLGPARKG
jgi:hypothetical protein